jgi:hypothetical protein
MKYEDIKDFYQRCEEHPDHQSGMISNSMIQQRLHEEIDELREYIEQASSQHGCAECGANGGHALYCVPCAEKFVGGYKENVPVHTSELLTQVSTDTQYAGNGTAGIQNETKPTGFFFQMPLQKEKNT